MRSTKKSENELEKNFDILNIYDHLRLLSPSFPIRIIPRGPLSLVAPLFVAIPDLL